MLASTRGRPELLVFELAGLERYGEKTLCLEEIISVLDEAMELGVRCVTLEVAGRLRTDDLVRLASSAAKRIRAVTISFDGELAHDGASVAEELADAGVADVALPYDFLRDGAQCSIGMVESFRDEGLGVRAVLAGWPGLGHVSELARALASIGATRLQIDLICGVTRCPVTSAMLARLATEVIAVARDGTLAMIVSELPMLRRLDVEAARAASSSPRAIPRAPIELIDGRTTMRIAPSGDITPSQGLPLIAGNVRRQRLDGIWSLPGLYRRLRDRERLVGRCGECAWRELCGGSRVRAWQVEGDYLAADPACALPIERATEIARKATA